MSTELKSQSNICFLFDNPFDAWHNTEEQICRSFHFIVTFKQTLFFKNDNSGDSIKLIYI